MNNKVVIIGCGNVGMSYAYALFNQRTYVNELALIDLDAKRVDGEVMDLNHCLAYSPSKVYIKRNILDKDHIYKKCPKCKTTLKLPIPYERGIKHTNCPKCKKRLTLFVLKKQKIEIIKNKK